MIHANGLAFVHAAVKPPIPPMHVLYVCIDVCKAVCVPVCIAVCMNNFLFSHKDVRSPAIKDR